MLFRGPYLNIRTWKQSLQQLIQEIRNQVEMYRPTNASLGDIPAARIVALVQDGAVFPSSIGGFTYVDGVTEETIASAGGRGRVRNSGFVRVQLLAALAPVAGNTIHVSATPGVGTTVPIGAVVGRVYDASDYATDQTVIIRLTCCQVGEEPI